MIINMQSLQRVIFTTYRISDSKGSSLVDWMDPGCITQTLQAAKRICESELLIDMLNQLKSSFLLCLSLQVVQEAK